jgi:putative peptidoglycan lipid II flippase
MSADSPALPEDKRPETMPPDAVAQARQEATNASVAGATGILALGNILSRVLGLMREQLLTFLFGASAALDAFQVAILVPRNFYDLLIGGHINGAIVPVLSEIVTVKGKDELWHVVSILFTLLTIAISGLVVIIELFAPQFVQLAAGGYDAQTLALAANLLRITAPALLFLGLFAIFSGTLYALNRFTWPAFAGAMFNAAIVITTFALAPPLQILLPSEIDPLQPIIISRPAEGIMAAALGWAIGAIVQMALQLPGLRISRIRFSFDWTHPALKSIALLYAPVMFSLVLDILVIRFFSYNLASQTGIHGAIVYMTLATTLIQFPQGLVATAISVAILPTLAGQAVQTAKEGLRPFRDTLGLGLRLAITLIIPAAFGLFVLANPIIALLFQNGEFTSADTLMTATALRYYLIGLPFAALDLLLVYAFYARKDTLTPALIGLFSHGVYIVAVLLLFEQFSLFSLMIADSVKHITHAIISGVLLHRRIDGFGDQRLLLTTVKTLFAAGIMALFAWWSLPILTTLIGTASILQEALLVLTAAGSSGALFLVLAILLGLEELRWLAGLIKRRLF